MKNQSFTLSLAFVFLASPALFADIKEAAGEVSVHLGDRHVTSYRTEGTARPFFYPLIGPSGASVTRHWPMKEGVKGEEQDHPHHQSLWFTHGDVNGIDFWSNPEHKSKMAKGRIRHDGFDELASDGESATIVARNSWIDMDDKVICTDRRTHLITDLGDGQTSIEFRIEITASEGDVTFGDTKEGSMAVRVAPTLRHEGKVAKGEMVNSEGKSGKDIWGKRAAWVDYHGPDANGETVGIAIVESPSNPRYPTWWHARDYGLLGANPFGIHYFEKKDKGAGDLKIAKGETLSLNYLVIVHSGTDEEAEIAGRAEKYHADETARAGAN